jgi:YidC/Oxa1 family membrane protein insertase
MEGGAPPAPPALQETFITLDNDALKVTLTSKGAAIKTVELKRHKADNGGNITLNEDSRSNILQLGGWPGADALNFQGSSADKSATFTADLPNGVHWQRDYAFGQPPDRDIGLSGMLRDVFQWFAAKFGQAQTKPEIYNLDVVDTLTNSGGAEVTLPAFSLGVGRAEPLYEAMNQWSQGRVLSSSNYMYLGGAWLTKKFRQTTLNDFNASSYLFGLIPGHGPRGTVTSEDIDPAPLRWLAMQNQFYVVLLTPDATGAMQHAEFHCYNERGPDGNVTPPGAAPDIEAAGNFGAVSIPAGKSTTLKYSLYAGPKDFNRLDQLGADQGALMNYDGFLPFSLLIVPMLTILKFWYLIFANYGVAIILLTLMIKGITWPLQSIANRAGKKMQALAPKLKELQAKYKEQPEKLQTETFALYKEYQVNPLGGCLPALIQMPVFFSLYYMLQNAVELRGQSFLWVHDLTKPDAVWTAPFLLLGWHPSIHPLPIIVTGLAAVMMRMTPQIGDPQQARIAQMMPLVFLVFFYNFAAALSLYYVINNCVSIIQIYRNLRKPMPELKRKSKK